MHAHESHIDQPRRQSAYDVAVRPFGSMAILLSASTHISRDLASMSGSRHTAEVVCLLLAPPNVHFCL